MTKLMMTMMKVMIMTMMRMVVVVVVVVVTIMNNNGTLCEQSMGKCHYCPSLTVFLVSIYIVMCYMQTAIKYVCIHAVSVLLHPLSSCLSSHSITSA